ncbi:flagellar basal body-associated FliL family protein [Oceanisphaera pacifica]|uniref:Flagellar protein FliL n=1 Tax=Oceanisphaera pacifica TaxID=2818389 RepID=A0ABS3NHK3_9GAMM|nr:flagellar basal body-associated FliL family protein [Oceanisphaera pacifica]MBO1519873.1 flagellar basal body-associated FliL family protein [Oceanisphaera pacifica]
MFRLLALCLLLAVGTLHAQEEEPQGPLYYTIEPDIITNYQNSGQSLGYVRVSIDLMLESADKMPLVEQHIPLLRDAINNLLAEQNRQEIRSLAVRNQIAKLGLERLNDLLLKETGDTPIRRLMFTKFLYQ